ncbi:MAG: MmgE/PrpD family protein [Anaerolineaceae bacterium]|nr:MmgE/PrpD family protein [Anaerolineaceae bacterium]
MMTDSIYALVKFAASAKSEDIPSEVMEFTKELLLDIIGCILSGSSARGISEIKELVDFWGGSEQAKIFSFDTQTSAPSAAFLNSVMGHANDYDDTHDDAVNHGCVTIVPAMMAACESLRRKRGKKYPKAIYARKISGKDFIAAMAIGLDISNRLGMAFIPFLHVGWLPTTLWGPIASAAACGRLLGLDEEQMMNAFGIAYSQLHGNRQGLVDGALSKRIQPGFSSSAGLKAAFFASNGITGAKNIIDGDFGIKALYTNGRMDGKYINVGIGSEFETMRISIKPYPCCRCTHPVIDAALSLRKQYTINWRDITGGIIHLPPQSMGQIGNEFKIRENPTVDAQFSAQYTAALAFIQGWPKVADFVKENVISRKDIIDLASKFRIIEHAKDRSGITPVKMTVQLGGQEEVDIWITEPKGSPRNPLNKEELNLKFNNCLDNSVKEYPLELRREIFKSIDHLLDCDDVTNLIDLL